jgi:hypothetical protein
VEFRIVGADTALCHFRNDDYYYKVYAPGTVRIQKTRKAINLRCVATGNRERIATIEPEVSDMIAANFTNGFVPGVTWDVVSGAAHSFPSVITVDFTGVPAQPMPLPEYQRVLNQNPGLIGLEEFRPGRAVLISDYSTPVPTLDRREGAAEQLDEFTTSDESGMKSVGGKVVAPEGSMAARVPTHSQIMTPSAPYGTPPAEFVGGSSATGETGGAAASIPARAPTGTMMTTPPSSGNSGGKASSADSLTREANPGSF